MNKTKEQLVKENARLQLKVQRLEVEFRMHKTKEYERECLIAIKQSQLKHKSAMQDALIEFPLSVTRMCENLYRIRKEQKYTEAHGMNSHRMQELVDIECQKIANELERQLGIRIEIPI